jgi:hypothetical protein
MRSTLRALILVVAAAAVAGPHAVAQTQTQAANFRARLTPVPVETSTAATITGSGVVTATLTGTKLSLSGTFGGMKSAATLAQVHMAPRGVRGPVEFDVTVEKGPGGGGTVSGSVTLTKVQVDSLRKGWFYIQIHAEKAPDGNLWGWLLPQ